MGLWLVLVLACGERGPEPEEAPVPAQPAQRQRAMMEPLGYADEPGEVPADAPAAQPQREALRAVGYVEVDTSPVARTWKLVSVAPTSGSPFPPVDRERHTLTLSPDGKVAAQLDCNRAMGSYVIDGSKLTVGPLASTKAMCGEASVGDRYGGLLAEAQSWSLVDGRLTVTASGGVLTFVE